MRRSAAARSYSVRMTIRSEGPNNDPKANRRLTVNVSSSGPGGCTGDTQGPVVTLTKPVAGNVYPSPNAYPVHFEASASDTSTGNNGVAFVEYKVNYPGPDQLILGPVTSGSPWPYDWTQSAVNAYLGTACAKFLEVQAYAQDDCGNSTYSAKAQITINNTGPCVTPDPGAAPGAVRDDRHLRERALRARRRGAGGGERRGLLPARGPEPVRGPAEEGREPRGGDGGRGADGRDLAVRAR